MLNKNVNTRVQKLVLKNSTLEQLNIYLRKAIRTDGAIKGNIQLYNEHKRTLSIIAHHGFDKPFLDHFKVVKAFDSSACGRAIGIGGPVMINDVEKDIGFKPHLKIARAEGFRAVRSIPLLSSENTFVGVLSTHFKDARTDWESKKMNSIAKELADLIRREMF